MLIRKQTGYDEFVCIADKCPKCCCIGWQIVIDEKSIERYNRVTGEFSTKLKAGIDTEESSFLQNHARCSMLGEDGLCELQKAMGEEYLCDTCRKYPRHEEEFLDLRERTLNLSCPEVVRMLIEPTYDFGFTEEENDEFDDPSEFEDCDLFLLDELAYSREKIEAFIKNRDIPFQKRLAMIGAAVFDMQSDYDFGNVELIGATCERFDDPKCLEAPIPIENIDPLNATGIPMDHSYALDSLSFLYDLEVLEDSWSDIIKETMDCYSSKDENSAEWKEAVHPEDQKVQAIFEKVFIALLYTYFCGSVYDGQIYARCMIAIWSVRWIMMIYKATDLTIEQVIYLYAREIEHSDENINALITVFEGELP
ncbi:MAG: flagellin lysine-N-methylase [Lachnospiraceae bacterium]|nr:flagellin lysine-N-methylase [Lachnospiraceae bacterium]